MPNLSIEPKSRSNKVQNTANNKRFFGCSGFVNVFLGFCGFELFPNGSLMIPDILQYLFDIFGNSKKFTKYGPSDPFLITELLQTSKKSHGNILQTSYFLQIWESKALFFESHIQTILKRKQKHIETK